MDVSSQTNSPVEGFICLSNERIYAFAKVEGFICLSNERIYAFAKRTIKPSF